MQNPEINLGGYKESPEHKAERERLLKAINAINGNFSLNEIPEETYDLTTYKCPICGERHRIDDCVIVNQEVDRKHTGTTSSKFGFDRTYTKHYIVTSYNIRICHKCAKKRALALKIALVVAILAFLGMMVRNIYFLPEKTIGNIIGQFFLVLFCGGFLCLLGFGLLGWVIRQFQEIDIENAKINNAIAPANYEDD